MTRRNYAHHWIREAYPPWIWSLHKDSICPQFDTILARANITYICTVSVWHQFQQLSKTSISTYVEVNVWHFLAEFLI